MLRLPISGGTFKRSFLGGDGNLEITSDQDVWGKLVNSNGTFDPSVDSIADVKVSLGTEKELALGRADSWKIGVSESVEAGHQIQLVWPDSDVPASVSRGLKPAAGSSHVVGRLVLRGKADASVKGRVPVGPLSATFGVAAGGSVGYERLVTFPKSTPARVLLKDLFAGVRLPQQVDSVAEIPAAGEALVLRFGGYLKMSGQLSCGYSMSGSKLMNVGELSLDLDYRLKLAASVSAAYRLAGNFELEACAGSSSNFARYRVFKSRESEFNFAADFGADAKSHLKGFPNTADEFLVKAFGMHAERALKLFDKAQTYANLDELEQKAGKLVKCALHELCGKYIGKALSNATLNEFATKMLAVVKAYNELDARIIHLYEDLLDNKILGLEKTLQTIVSATSPDALKQISDNGVWQLVTRLAGPKLHDVLINKAVFDEFSRLAQSSLDFLNGGAQQEIRDFVATFKDSLPLNSMLEQLKHITTPKQLQNLADEKLQGLAEQILGKTFDQIRASNAGRELKTLNDALNKVEAFRKKFYDKIKQTADSSFQASLHLAYAKSNARTALLDVEIDVSAAEGQRLARLATSGDFEELLESYNSSIVRINQGVLTHAVASSTQLQINLFGYAIEGFSRMLQESDEALEPQAGGLLHVYTTKTSIETRSKHGGELTASTFMIATVAEAFQKEGVKDFLIRTLPKVAMSYDLAIADDKTRPDELRQILDLAELAGIVTDRDTFVRQLTQEFPKGLGKVSARYVIRYDADALRAAFQMPDNALHDNLRSAALDAMRAFISARYIGMRPVDWAARLGFAYADPLTFRDFQRLGFAAFASSHVNVTLPGWFTRGAPQTVELPDGQKRSLITLFNYQERFLNRIVRLDDTIDRLRAGSGGISPKDLDDQVRDFLDMADDLGEFRENAFFFVVDRLVLAANGGKVPRNSSLVLEIAAPGKQTVTKVLTAARAAAEGAEAASTFRLP